jgi:hypothetical protein
MRRHLRATVFALVAFGILATLQFLVICEAHDQFFHAGSIRPPSREATLLPQTALGNDLHDVAVAVAPVVLQPLGGVLRRSSVSRRGGFAGTVRGLFDSITESVPPGRPTLFVFAISNSLLWLVAGAAMAGAWRAGGTRLRGRRTEGRVGT